MKHTGERRSVFKKGKGRAFLRFLLGELILVALVSVVYLFVLQADVTSLLPASPANEATVTATPEAAATETPAPTPVETIEPTSEPTPAPTATPIPFEELSRSMGEEAPEAPALPDASLKLGMSEFRAFNEAGQMALILKGHAYIEGLDAANSTIYVMVSDAGMGQLVDMYQAVSAPETASLSFEESSGSNLANAFFTAKIDVSEYYAGSYLLSVVVVNEDKVAMNYFDARPFHFTVVDGVLSVEE